jgi:HD-like signal output (HDOD) protein/signal transduction histidine kinase
MDNPLLAKIETSKSLPTLPHILLQLIDICNREEKGIRDLTKVINQDPSISERVLRLVNSAYYSLKQKITSIEQALLLLGMDAVKNIAISSSVHQVFHRPRGKSAFNLKLFWWHSLSCGVIARRLAFREEYPNPDEAFLCGLMHDIGKIVLWVNFEEEYESILKSSGYRSEDMLRAEKALGLTHAEAGAWLIRRWDLRSFMPDAVLYHHDPADRVLHSSVLVKIVYSANLLCPIVKQELEGNFAAATKVLEVPRDELEQILGQAEEEVRQIADSLDIDIKSPEPGLQSLSAEDREKYEELAGWVRDISLLQSSSEIFLKAEDRTGVLQATRQGLQLLFDVKYVFFFQYSEGALVGIPMGSGDQEDVIRELSIPFREESSLLVKALIQQRILDTFDADQRLSILDEQLVRFLGAEGMLCLPVMVREEKLGALILGIQRSQRDILLKKRRLLTMFLNLSALALFGFQVRAKQADRIREERVSAVSILAKKVVHEAHNPLGIINNYLSILANKLTNGASVDASVQDDLRIVREEIRRVSQIIGELSSVAKPPEVVKEPVNINSILQDLVKISRDALLQSSKINIELTLDQNVPMIKSDGNKLKQVFINLLKNSVEAMPDGGKIGLETRFRHGAPANIEITIKDRGSGIPEALQNNLFEPFTSSKGHEGLGLSIAYTIVKELNGRLSYDTSSEGTSFQIRLPVE